MFVFRKIVEQAQQSSLDTQENLPHTRRYETETNRKTAVEYGFVVMIGFDDKHWEGLKGGYKVVYDPRPVLHELEDGSPVAPIWEELWGELHHQGDIGEASYAAVPYLVRHISRSTTPDWNAYGLVAVVEIERHRKGNPPLPAWISGAYFQAWGELLALASRDLKVTDDPITVRTILGTIALAKGELKLGAFIVDLDTSEIDEFLETRSAWSSFYSEQDSAATGSRG